MPNDICTMCGEHMPGTPIEKFAHICTACRKDPEQMKELLRAKLPRTCPDHPKKKRANCSNCIYERKTQKTRIKLSPKGHIGGYHLRDGAQQRRRALLRRIRQLARQRGETERRSAKRVKARLNVQRIYRKRRAASLCQRITQDMKFLDRRYGGATRTQVCT